MLTGSGVLSIGHTKLKDWQKVFLRAAGAAAGVTVALAGVALLLHWYSSRPKSWDTKAVSSVSSNAGAFYEIDAVRREVKTAGFSLKFVLANNNGRDYTVPLNVKLLQRQAGTEALEEFSGKLEHGREARTRVSHPGPARKNEPAGSKYRRRTNDSRSTPRRYRYAEGNTEP